jgi:hypothetical protein
MKQLKVYGWTGYRTEAEASPNGMQQTREIVAATSVAQVMRISGKTRHYLTNYGGETGNTEELRVALAEPGIIFWTELTDSRRDVQQWRRS